MKKQLFWLAWLLSPSLCWAYNIAGTFTVQNTSDYPVYMMIVEPLQASGGGAANPVHFGPNLIPANQTVTMTPNIQWPANTLPGGALTGFLCDNQGNQIATGSCDGGGSQTWPSGTSTIQVSGNWVVSGAPCRQSYTVTSQNPDPTMTKSPTVTFSDGTVEGPYVGIPGGGTFSDELTEACGLTWTVTWGTGGGTISEDPSTNGLTDLSTNEQTLVNTPPDTTSTVPPVPPSSSSNIVWQPSGTAAATDQNIKDLGNGINNTLWTANQQDRLDSSAIVQAINTAKTQAHSDAGTLKSAIDTGRQQNHSDLGAIAKLLQNITNGGVGVNMTNYALNSTLVANATQENTNFGALISAVNSNGITGLRGALTNATDAVNGLANAISNITDITNLDIASENTLQGGTNLLGIINSNIVAMATNRPALTNYNLQTTQVGISNLLSFMATNDFGWSNGLTVEQLSNQVTTYQQQMSNSQDYAMSQMAALTNQTSQMGMGSVVAAVQGGLPGMVQYDSPGGVSPQVITLASGISFSLGSGMPSYGPLRQVLAWATIVGLFLWNWRTTYSKIRDVFTANQARTAGTEILGSNVNLSSAMLMAVAIFAAATAIPTFAVALLTNEVSLFISVGDPLSMFGGFGWGFAFLDQYIPLATIISAVTSRVVFNVIIDSIAAVVMAIKLFLVGL